MALLRTAFSVRLNSLAAVQRLFQVSKVKSTAVANDSHTEPEASEPRPFSEIPGDKGWPFIGSMDVFTKMGSDKVREETLLHEVYLKYGPIARLRTVGNQWIVFVTTPEATEACFRAEGKNPSRGALQEDIVCHAHKKNNWPNPLIFAADEDWKRIRSAIRKQVIPKRVANLTAPLCDITDDLLDHLEKISSNSDGKIEDLTPIITQWTFQTIAYFLLGENMRIFRDNDPFHHEFIKAGLDFLSYLRGIILRPLPIYKYIPLRNYREFIQATAHMRELAKQVMERNMVQLSEDITRGTVDETKAVGILEQWLIEGKLEPEDALTQACDLFAAGLDTTKNTTTFMLYELAKQPVLQDQIYHEIKAVLGDKVNPSWEDLQNIPLVRSCLKETMRLYSPIAVTIRQIREDAVLSGYHVPAGTIVISNQGTMSLSEEYFDAPKKFIPERWSKDKDSIHPFLSLPFGFGPRGCYGRRLAELEIFILLTKLIPRFMFSTDQDSLAIKMGTVQEPNEPVTISIRPRENFLPTQCKLEPYVTTDI